MITKRIIQCLFFIAVSCSVVACDRDSQDHASQQKGQQQSNDSSKQSSQQQSSQSSSKKGQRGGTVNVG